MSSYFKLEIVSNVGVLNTTLGEIASFRILTDSDFDTNRILYFFHLGTRRIMCCKLSLNECTNEVNCTDVTPEKSCEVSNSTSLSFLKALTLPISVNHLISCNQNLWAVGSENCLDVKFHSQKLFQESFNRNSNDDRMDTCMEDEFHLSDYELVVERQYLLKHNVQDNFFCFKCDLIHGGFGICIEDNIESSWNVMLIMPNSETSMDAEALQCSLFFKFPLSFRESDSFTKDAARKCPTPVIIFYDSNHKIWNTLFKSQRQTASNHLCLIGHPEGKILYFLCSGSNQNLEFKLLTEIQQLHDMKQAVLGIHFYEKIADVEGSDFLIIVGEMGKLAIISSQAISSESISIPLTKGLLVTTVQLPLPIKNYIILNGCILYLSKKRDLWISKFDTNKRRKSEKQYLQLLNEVTHFCDIMHMLIINDIKGLFLAIRNNGSMYLIQCCTSGKNSLNQISLPIIMNAILNESLILKEFSLIKELQNKLFASISTLAKLKFRDGKKIQIDCVLKEIEGPPRKFLLDLNMKNVEDLNLYPEFWLLTASLYSHFQRDSAIISKTQPLLSGHSLYVEVLESLICPSYSSPFPLYLEIGLILCLPKELEVIDCFKLLITKLPFYVRTHTFILNELNLLKSKVEMHKIQSFTNDNCENIFQGINDYNSRNSVYSLLDKKHPQENLAYICNEFTLCLLESHAKNMVKIFNEDSDLAESILKILGSKSYLQEIDGSKLICRNKPITLSVTHRGNIVYITVSSKYIVLLLGLRMAIAESLLNSQDNSSADISNCVKIPASLLKKCEALSTDFIDMHGKDVTTSDFLGNALEKYHKLRTEISQNVPF